MNLIRKKEKMSTEVLVIGAGAGGLGAGSWLKEKEIDFHIVDVSSSLPMNLHNGVHYLHSIPELPDTIDHKIKEITLTDGILGEYGKIRHKPSLNDSLNYSKKVREVQHPSSIMSVGKRDTVYMPESNNMNFLLSTMAEYIGKDKFTFGWKLAELDPYQKKAYFLNQDKKTLEVSYQSCISTVPLQHIKSYFIDMVVPELKSNPVHITNYRVRGIVPNWLINLYVPKNDSPIYRMSLLNGFCSVESVRDLDKKESISAPSSLFSMFDIDPFSGKPFTWETGKVMSISIDERLKIIEEMHNEDFYQIGRFGLWDRHLLVDSTINQAKEVVEYLYDSDDEHWHGYVKNKLANTKYD